MNNDPIEITPYNLAISILQVFWMPLIAALTTLNTAIFFNALCAKYVGNIVAALAISHEATQNAILDFAYLELFILGLFTLYFLICTYYRPKLYQYMILKMSGHTIYHNKKYFQEHNSGEILHAITNLTRSTGAIIRFYLWISMVIVNIVTTIWICYTLHYQIGMLMLAWLMTFCTIVYYFGRIGGSHAVKFTAGAINLAGQITDTLDNIHNVHATCAQQHEIELIQSKAEKVKEIYRNQEMTFAIGGTFQSISLIAATVGSVYLASYLYFTGDISIGDITQYFTLSLTLGHIVWSIPRDVATYIEDQATYNTCIDFLGKPVKAIQGPQQAILSGDIQVNNLTFNYQDKVIFNNLNLCIKQGESIGLVGRSGAGKTTLMNLLLGESQNGYNGNIYIGNNNLRELNIVDLRALFALVPQEITLFRRSIRDNITYGLTASDTEIIQAAHNASAHNFIEMLPQQYDTIIGEKATQLSGGQKQRIMLARAFLRLRTAKILIIDEGTSALDNTTERQISHAIEHIIQRKDVTSIFIAHRLSTLRALPRIVVLNESGSVAEEGTHETLLAKESSIYKSLWNDQYV